MSFRKFRFFLDFDTDGFTRQQDRCPQEESQAQLCRAEKEEEGPNGKKEKGRGSLFRRGVNDLMLGMVVERRGMRRSNIQRLDLHKAKDAWRLWAFTTITEGDGFSYVMRFLAAAASSASIISTRSAMQIPLEIDLKIIEPYFASYECLMLYSMITCDDL